jgi:hypothetical protein
MLTADMRAVLDAARLAFVATVTPEVAAIDKAAPLFSPIYWTGVGEAEIREQWKPRRAELDRDFEYHLDQHGTIGPQGDRLSSDDN